MEAGEAKKVLVVWRDCEKVPDAQLARYFADREFGKVTSGEYDRIYVNGDPLLDVVKRDDEHWKVLPIEDEFRRRMFVMDDV